MKSGDGMREHQEAMQAFAAHVRRKIAYYHEKAYLEYEDIYTLVHDVLGELMKTSAHLTEEEFSAKLEQFNHEFVTVPRDLITSWQTVLTSLSRAQYSGEAMTQETLHTLLSQVIANAERTIEIVSTPIDDFTKHVQAIKVFVQHGDLARAEERYLALHKEYETLTDERKRMHYARLQDTYHLILDARSAQPVVHQ